MHASAEFTKPLLVELREMVDTQHRNAMRAVQVLEEYLQQSSSGKDEKPGFCKQDALVDLLMKMTSPRTKRRMVLESISDEWRSVRDIARLTGLPESQVRGVLYAKALQRSLQRDSTHGELRFRLAGPVIDEVLGSRSKGAFENRTVPVH